MRDITLAREVHVSVRLLPNGVMEFDTVMEAVEFRRLFESNGATPVSQKTASQDKTRDSGGNLSLFLKNLDGNLRSVVKALCDAEGPLTTEELATSAGLST